VLERNIWLAGAELDLVVRRGRTVVFVEVKSKGGHGYGDPLEMVTPVKVERLRRAAGAWLAREPALRVRFDVAAERAGKLEVMQDAF
jgi:putative endonuclease